MLFVIHGIKILDLLSKNLDIIKPRYKVLNGKQFTDATPAVTRVVVSVDGQLG